MKLVALLWWPVLYWSYIKVLNAFSVYEISDKYVAHMEPQCRTVDSEFDKLSLGHENGFLWDEVNPESSEQQRKDGLPKESASEVGISNVFGS